LYLKNATISLSAALTFCIGIIYKVIVPVDLINDLIIALNKTTCVPQKHRFNFGDLPMDDICVFGFPE